MSQAVDRIVPNWGKTHPIAELEAVITELNQLRVKANHGNWDWERARNRAFSRAGKLLRVSATRRLEDGQRNAVVGALDCYRDDWRGQVVVKVSGDQFLAALFKRTDWELVAKQARRVA